MAQSKSSNKRAQGGGRTPNSEPRQQVFKEFGGCNFELSPRDFTLGKDVYPEQADLQMNYVVIQNNAGVSSNKTIETRNNILGLFSAPEGKSFTDACILIRDQMFFAMSDGEHPAQEPIMVGKLGIDSLSNVTLNDVANRGAYTWRSFAYADNQLIGTTEENLMWTSGQINWGNIGSMTMSNAKTVANPSSLVLGDFTPKGSLEIASTSSDACPYRVAVSYAYINKFGPTRYSTPTEIWTNYEVAEWHGGRYLRITGHAPTDSDILAVEIYYSSGNSSQLLFAGRTDFSGGNGGDWTFDWYGYLDATNMWPVANLIAPTENYTSGVHASHLTCIDSRMYFWGDSSQPQRLYIGGNSGNLFSVSPGTGGGFVDVEPGSGQEIRVVTKYKTQSGASIVTMLCDSKNTTMEQRFNLVENSVSLSNEQNMKSWQAEQVAGAVGCKSFDGAVVCEDGLYSISRYGLALTTMTMEYNSQIRANYVSDPIKPVFIDKNRSILKNSVIIECDGIIYLAFGRDDQKIDNMLFCYDIDKKAWWTITLDVDEPILKLVHIDCENYVEGIGIVTEKMVYLLPLTMGNSPKDEADFTTTIQTGELSIMQPQQGWFYLSQLEFLFDYFIGSVDIELTGIDLFGRKVTTSKTLSCSETAYNFKEHMRVDLRLRSYQIRIKGQARFRMTHFIAKLFTMSAKQDLVLGFDDAQSFRSFGDIHPTFKDYNDIKQAIDEHGFPHHHTTPLPPVPEYEVYPGPYEVTPTTDEQFLYTRDKLMEDDVTVHQIPYSLTTNQAGGYTASIAS